MESHNAGISEASRRQDSCPRRLCTCSTCTCLTLSPPSCVGVLGEISPPQVPRGKWLCCRVDNSCLTGSITVTSLIAPIFKRKVTGDVQVSTGDIGNVLRYSSTQGSARSRMISKQQDQVHETERRHSHPTWDLKFIRVSFRRNDPSKSRPPGPLNVNPTFGRGSGCAAASVSCHLILLFAYHPEIEHYP